MIWLLPVAFALPNAGPGGETSLPGELTLNGDVKTFMTGSFPYESDLLPDDPWGQGTSDVRLKAAAQGESWRVEAHHAVSAVTAPAAFGSTFGTGVGLNAPEAIDLTWEVDSDDLQVQGRTDRLSATVSIPHLNATVGRQPISFGSGLFFTPMDLVNPFSPATIDSEYKAGVDAARIDGFWGMAGKATAVAAHAGDWDREGAVFAIYAQETVGVTDIGIFAGAVHADEVAGLSVASSVGAVGVHGDATATLPADDAADPFVRAVVGTDWRPFDGTGLSAEVYLQTNGASDPDDYLEQSLGERYARGELWALGRTYAGLSVMQAITPLVTTSVFGIVNLDDGSALLGPSLAWSVADDASLSGGAFVGLGERPKLDGFTVVLPSEFGLIPTTVYLRMAAYF